MGDWFPRLIPNRHLPKSAPQCYRPPYHWAGTETSEVFCGYVDGAVRSGERVAAEVAELLGQPARA